jgi:hypothetical protein
LVKLNRKGARIDLRQEFPLFYGVAFFEEDPVEPAVDLGPYGDRHQRNDVAEPFHGDGHVAPHDRRCRHRDHAIARARR